MTIDKYILDDDGNPVPEPDLLTWGRWMETADRRVAFTRVALGEGDGGVDVSTVFLGLDQAFRQGPIPILYETMVFGGPRDGESWRYATRAEAVAGHERACAVALVGDAT